MKYKTCKLCGEKIKNEKDMIKPNNRIGNVHIECYRNALLENDIEVIVNEKINHFMEERDIEINIKLEKLKEKNDIKLKNKKNSIKDSEFKKQFYEYLKLNYDCSLTTYMFSKIANIVNGTYKGLREGISYEDLLYMFKTKQRELNRIADDKKRKGNEFKDNSTRLSFDLAVVVNKYDSYKKWKEKQVLLETKNEDIKKITEGLIDTKSQRINNHNNKKENDDISDILDEVF